MPFQANLRDISATQVLNLVNLAGKTGTLNVYEGVPTGEKDANQNPKMRPGRLRASFAFKAGKLIYAALGDAETSLVTVLNRVGKLTDEQARIIRERAKDRPDKALALLLINANYVTQTDIVNAIQQYTLEVVANMASWPEGPFRFEDDVLPDRGRILVPIDLENVIMDIARTQKENEHLLAYLPSLDVVLRYPDDPKTKFKGVHLNVQEWRVVSFVNPRNTIRMIAKQHNMTDMEIRRVVYGLLMAGLVELVKAPAGTPPAKQPPARQTPSTGGARQSAAGNTTRPVPAPEKRVTVDTRVGATVIDRIIERIKSL